MSARRRAFVFTAAIVLAVLLLVLWSERQRNATPPPSPPPARERGLRDSVSLPRIRADEYRRTARDTTREERLLIDSAALELALSDARALDDALFEPLGGVELDAQRSADVLATPDAARGRLFRARGRIESSIHVDAFERVPEHWRGRLALEDGSHAFFAVLALPEGAATGDFVRLDGLFVEVASEANAGGWLDAPLLAGARAVRSFPALGRVDSLAGIETATTDAAQWTLVAYARDVDPAALDWNSAPVLDRKLMEQLDDDESRWRGRPVRIADARLQELAISAHEENPARAPSIARGWLGRWEWRRAGRNLTQFVLASTELDLRTGDAVEARGFFAGNASYTSAGRGPQTAPLFVLQSLERRAAPPPRSLGHWLAYFALAAAGLLALVCAVVRRDERQARAFERAQRRRDDEPRPPA